MEGYSLIEELAYYGECRTILPLGSGVDIDLLERMEKELDQEPSTFSDDVCDLSMVYLRDEFVYSLEHAEELITDAIGFTYKGRDSQEEISLAFEQIIRTERALALAQRIDPNASIEAGSSYNRSARRLGSLKKSLHFICEYPTLFRELIAVQEEIDNAVEVEDFDKAAEYKVMKEYVLARNK